MTRKTLYILCLGDSLTAGYTSMFRPQERPYGTKLKEVLEKGLSDIKVEVEVDGEPGACVEGVSFRQRLTSRYEKLGDTRPFDWVIILGGTNDLPGMTGVSPVWEALKSCYSIALDKGSQVLALTVPEATTPDGRSFDELDEGRDQLNEMIKGHVADTLPNFHAFDLCRAIPNIALDYADRKKYWADGVHRTAAGYDQMGEEVGIALLAIIRQEETRQK